MSNKRQQQQQQQLSSDNEIDVLDDDDDDDDDDEEGYLYDLYGRYFPERALERIRRNHHKSVCIPYNHVMLGDDDDDETFTEYIRALEANTRIERIRIDFSNLWGNEEEEYEAIMPDVEPLHRHIRQRPNLYSAKLFMKSDRERWEVVDQPTLEAVNSFLRALIQNDYIREVSLCNIYTNSDVLAALLQKTSLE